MLPSGGAKEWLQQWSRPIINHTPDHMSTSFTRCLAPLPTLVTAPPSSSGPCNSSMALASHIPPSRLLAFSHASFRAKGHGRHHLRRTRNRSCSHHPDNIGSPCSRSWTCSKAFRRLASGGPGRISHDPCRRRNQRGSRRWRRPKGREGLRGLRSAWWLVILMTRGLAGLVWESK